MSVVETDSSSTTAKNERLQGELERALARNIELEEALRKVRTTTDAALKELARIELFEVQIGQALNSLKIKRAHLEEALLSASHSSDKLLRQTG